eukprot:CAMPEP_0204566078 /NCGR_PEP_ID=MMETSP0661-20131031/35848_1 /ASSEMBLY_ACC=CAM_ASM_000606 /TAXON_ID=109239 /ORGANISM="Alexandrium margalefi, Strain AMGDE01CS-322" /LENGTH=43 /DNA_ID= /DNA_START= /DNA_END= /DNA_ORIENTATION=
MPPPPPVYPLRLVSPSKGGVAGSVSSSSAAAGRAFLSPPTGAS